MSIFRTIKSRWDYKESTDAVSGSDRLIWLCTSFSIFKAKSSEEVAEDGPTLVTES